jgi:hypothetical protein
MIAKKRGMGRQIAGTPIGVWGSDVMGASGHAAGAPLDARALQALPFVFAVGVVDLGDAGYDFNFPGNVEGYRRENGTSRLN